MIQVWGGHHHVAAGANSFYADQDLDLDTVDHGQDSAEGPHVTTVPGCFIVHDGALQPVDQLSNGHVVRQEIDVPGINRQATQCEGGATTDGPSAVPDNR